MTTKTRATAPAAGKFAEHANLRGHGMAAEMLHFVASTGKWWLIPVLAALAMAGGLLILGSSAAAPFIYTVF